MGTKENFSTNPFMTVLRTNFEKLYRSIYDHQSHLLVPTSSCIIRGSITQEFIEAHVVHSTHMKNHFLNLIGQGIEIKDGVVCTSFGCREHRICNILQRESFFEFSNSIQVIVIDRPLQGVYNEYADQLLPRSLQTSRMTAGLSSDEVKHIADGWLKALPGLEFELNQAVETFKRTYILVAGLEHETAYRIGEMISLFVSKLSKCQRVNDNQERNQQLLEHVTERLVYSKLHSFLWNHLVSSLKDRDQLLRAALYGNDKDTSSIIARLKIVLPPSLKNLSLDAASEKLNEIQGLETPPEKIACLHETCRTIQCSVEDHVRKQGKMQKKHLEITADELLHLMTVTVAQSHLSNPAAHAAHMDMYLAQKPAETRIQRSSYMLSSFHAALCSVLVGQDEPLSQSENRNY